MSAVAGAEPVATTTELREPAGPIGIWDPVSFMVVVRPSPDDGGTVTLVRNGVGLVEDEISPNGVAHLSLPNGLTAGTHTFVATYNGSESSAPSTSDAVVVEVIDDRTPVTVTLESDGSPSLRGEPVGLRITVEPDPGGGSVQVVRADHSGMINLPVPIGDGGVTDVTWTPTATFDYPIKACFSGNIDFMEDCGPSIVQSVFAHATTTTLEILPAEITTEESVTFRVTVDPPPETAIDARVGKSPDHGWFVGISPETGVGETTLVAFIVRNELGVGSHSLIAFYPGSPNTDPSQSSPMDLDVVGLDSTGPSGSVTIAGGRAVTATSSVTLAVPATDADSSVSQVELSNDGVNWTTRPYAASQSWTLPATNGIRTVYAKWKDAANNWSAVKTDTIVLDTVAPTATEPRRGLVAATTIDAGRITLRVPWSGTDATSGIARYELLQSTDGGAWTVVSTTLTAPTADRSLSSLHTYRFRVRAVDKAGNVGAWVFGTPFWLARYSEFNSAITYSGSWTTVSDPAAYWGGAAKRSGTAGAQATLSFTGRAAAWVARTGPNRGVATVSVNGTKVATVDLYAPTYGNQRVVWARNWSTSAARTVSIRVDGTPGRPLVDVDAFVAAN